jgi:flagellar basal body-associated protein FliL
MKRSRIIIIAVVILLVACPLAAAFFMATGSDLPSPTPPLTPIISPTVIERLTAIPSEQPADTTPDAVPIFATHAAIETHIAATTTAQNTTSDQ